VAQSAMIDTGAASPLFTTPLLRRGGRGLLRQRPTRGRRLAPLGVAL